MLQFDEKQTDFPLDSEQRLDKEELSRFIVVHSLELVMEFTSEVRHLPGCRESRDSCTQKSVCRC